MKLQITNYKLQKDSGYAAITTMVMTLVVSLIVLSGFTFFTLQEVNNNRTFSKSIESRYVSEGGIEDAVYRIITAKQIGSQETLRVGRGETTISVVTAGSRRTVRSEGKFGTPQRNLETIVDVSTASVNFYYGVQVGEGGVKMDNNSTITGNIFSNGSIVGANGAEITGDVIVATGVSPTPTLQVIANDSIFNFATSNSNRDTAQSFTANASGRLNKVTVYLGKNGAPSNITLRIVTTDGAVDRPDRSGEIASAVIPVSSVGTTPSAIDVSFNNAPNLVDGVKYWIVLDYGSSSGVNNWKWSYDSNDANYTGGAGKYASDWNAPNASWTDVGGDLNFRVWIGGVNNKIDAVTIGDSSSGTAYADLFVNATVHGSSCPNAYCVTDDPQSPQALPISDGVIQDFKDDAASGGIWTGDYVISSNESLGPKEITGNLVFGTNNITITITGTVYVRGNIDFSRTGIKVQCSSSFGENSCVLVTDGWVDVKNNASFRGSGQSSESFIMFLSTIPCDGVIASPPCDTSPANGAVMLRNNALGAIFYASRGLITLENGVNISEATAYKLHLSQDANVTYEQGLANVHFTSGPSGGYDVLNWREVP